MTTTPDNRLGCGRDIDAVWASIDRSPNAHEQVCPHCREARGSLRPLAAATAAQRAAETVDPDLEPGPQVLSHVMEVARAEVRRRRRLPLDEPPLPTDDDKTIEPTSLTVSEQTVAAVARRVADSSAGVQVRRSRVELAPFVDGGAAAPVEHETPARSEIGTVLAPFDPITFTAARPARVAVFLQISVLLGTSIPRISQEIRTAVRSAVSHEVGLQAVTVHIDVRDIHEVADV